MNDKDKIALRKLTSEVHSRNMIAKFQDINLATIKVAAIPSVGVFWVDIKANKVYADSTLLKDAIDYGDFKINDNGHYEAWSKIAAQNSKWRGLEYEDIPRGRVVYKKDAKKPMFYVVMCHKCNTPKIKSAVVNEFNLPTGFYEFDFDDQHYIIED